MLGFRFAFRHVCNAYLQLFINNHFVDGKSGSKLPVVDPRTGETILEIEQGSIEDVDRAVHAASEAFNEGPWPKTAAQVLLVRPSLAIMHHSVTAMLTTLAVQERGRMLYRLADLVEENAEELALLETLVSKFKPSVNTTFLPRQCAFHNQCLSDRMLGNL